MKEVKVYSLMTYASIDDDIDVQVFGSITEAVAEFISTLEKWIGESTSNIDHETNVSATAEQLWDRVIKSSPSPDDFDHYCFYEAMLKWAQSEPRWDGQWITLRSHKVLLDIPA